MSPFAMNSSLDGEANYGVEQGGFFCPQLRQEEQQEAWRRHIMEPTSIKILLFTPKQSMQQQHM